MEIENIKFKAKKTLDGKWIKGDLVHHKDSDNVWITDYENQLTSPVDQSTVCMFTGLKDCEGNEVWEGDLLQSQITESIYEIVWHKFLGFIMKNPRSGGHLSETLGCLLQLGKFKVIGNKFDNDKQDKTMVDISNQKWNKDGSITIILNSIEEVEELVECFNIWNKICEDEE